MQTLTFDQLRVMAKAGGVATVTLQGDGRSFYVRIKSSNDAEAMLSSARHDRPRPFSNPLPAIALLHKLGLMIGIFDVSNWNPELNPLARSRPERAAAMKQDSKAIGHDRWFRAQVAKGLAAADDPGTRWVTHEEMKSAWARKRAALVKLANGKGD